MRVLAIDPGSKRVGMAISDPSGTIAQPMPAVEAEPRGTLAQRLADVARRQEATRLIVGLPRRLDGSNGPEAQAARRLAGELRDATGLPVEMADERMTTAAAERALIAAGVRRGKRKATIDGVAAALLLQSHLDSRR